MLDSLEQLGGSLRDPDSLRPQQPSYITGNTRSLKEEFLIVEGICTHLGCAPTYRPDVRPEDLGAAWLGGFFCPCHGSRFDLSGRVCRDVPAPANLVIPLRSYEAEEVVVIGVDEV